MASIHGPPLGGTESGTAMSRPRMGATQSGQAATLSGWATRSVGVEAIDESIRVQRPTRRGASRGPRTVGVP
jgi:hypothetical protein